MSAVPMFCFKVPAEDSNYDIITGLPWQPAGRSEKSASSAWRWWPLWGKAKKEGELPLHKGEEQQPLLQRQVQQQNSNKCQDCALLKAAPFRPPSIQHPALIHAGSGYRFSTAEAAGAIAGHKTLASFGSLGSALPAGGNWECSMKSEGNVVRPLPFPAAMPLGFRTRGRIDFENVSVAYR